MTKIKDRELMKNFLDRFKTKSKVGNLTNRESLNNFQDHIKD